MHYEESTFHFIPDWEFAYSVDRQGNVYSHKSKKILKQSINRMGYPVVTLNDDVNGRTITLPIHRIVAKTYIGIPDGLVVCHTDGNPLNNHVDNLRVDSMKSNSLDMVRHGRAGKIKKLTDEQIEYICKDTRTNQAIADDYGISNSYVTMLKQGKRRSSVSRKEGSSP